MIVKLSEHKTVIQKLVHPCLIFITNKKHKKPYKERYIAGSSKNTNKPVQLTKILTTIKDHLQSYSDKVYSTSGTNQILILKKSKELLGHLKSHSLAHINSIKTYDFSTLYTTILHTKLKSHLKNLINQCFFDRNEKRRYKYLVFCRETSYFVVQHTYSKSKYTEDDIINMLAFLIDNIFVMFGKQMYPMGRNCAPLLEDLGEKAEFCDLQKRKFQNH